MEKATNTTVVGLYLLVVFQDRQTGFARLLGCCQKYLNIFWGRLVVDWKLCSCTSTKTIWVIQWANHQAGILTSKPVDAASTAICQLNRRAGEILTWDVTLHEFVSWWIPGVRWNISNILWLALECLSKLHLINLGCLS